jgi:hypothetical protein
MDCRVHESYIDGIGSMVICYISVQTIFLVIAGHVNNEGITHKFR